MGLSPPLNLGLGLTGSLTCERCRVLRKLVTFYNARIVVSARNCQSDDADPQKHRKSLIYRRVRTGATRLRGNIDNSEGGLLFRAVVKLASAN